VKLDIYLNILLLPNQILPLKQLWPSHLRALATIAIVVLHTSAPVLYLINEVSISTWFIGNIYNSSTRFAVPVFFMISGAMLFNQDYNLKTFFIKRFKRILPPLIFWSIVYMLYFNVFDNLGNNWFFAVIIKIIKNLFTGSSCYHLWFVYTLMGLYFSVPIMRTWVKYASKKEIRYFLLIWLISTVYCSSYLKEFLPTIELVNFSGFLGYMVLGYYLSKINYHKKYILVLFFGLSIVFTIFSTYYVSDRDSAYNGTFYSAFLANNLIASTSIFLLIKNLTIRSQIISTLLLKIDSCSYGIYLSHILILLFIENHGINWRFTYPIFSIPITAIVTISISMLIIHIGRKFKITKLLMG
jgi:surface polysaccharide O-acyltransferase-like enzyme